MAKVTVINKTDFKKEHIDMKKRLDNYSLIQSCLIGSVVLNIILIGVLFV